MPASDALVGEALSISPWKEALAERDTLKDLLDAAVGAIDLLLERVDHIGCHNCGTNGRPSPCLPCQVAIDSADRVKGKI